MRGKRNSREIARERKNGEREIWFAREIERKEMEEVRDYSRERKRDPVRIQEEKELDPFFFFLKDEGQNANFPINKSKLNLIAFNNSNLNR